MHERVRTFTQSAATKQWYTTVLLTQTLTTFNTKASVKPNIKL